MKEILIIVLIILGIIVINTWIEEGFTTTPPLVSVGTTPPLVSVGTTPPLVSVGTTPPLVSVGTTPSFDSNNYDLTYHDEVPENGLDISNNLSSVSVITYSPTKSSTSYVPNYENSIYLSSYKQPQQLASSQSSQPLSNNPLGFCATDSLTQEQQCNNLPKGVCASTECCVLLGGTKCVAGNQYGPSLNSNYSDPLVLNRDYYYYSGKCYGNCDQVNEPIAVPFNQ